jgi:hypothetical protein
LGEEADVQPLQKTEGGKAVLKSSKAHNVQKVIFFIFSIYYILPITA